MAWEKFTKKGQGRPSGSPAVSIYTNKNGSGYIAHRFSFNKRAVESFGLHNYESVDLYYDTETGQIGFKPNDAGIYKFFKSSNENTYHLNATRFVAHYGVAPRKSIPLQLADDGLIVTVDE